MRKSNEKMESIPEHWLKGIQQSRKEKGGKYWEELKSIQAYDAAIAANDTTITFNDAVSEIENSR